MKVIYLNCVNESDPRSNVDDQLPVGLLAQLVERCTGHPHYCVFIREDHFHSRLYPQFKYMTFIYS